MISSPRLPGADDLEMRNVLVKMNNPTRTFLMEVPHRDRSLRDGTTPHRQVEGQRRALLKEKIYAAHSYYFRPGR